MPTAARLQQRYDHRLRDLVQRSGDLTIATKLGVPRSTARGWRGAAPTVVVGLEVANLTAEELRQEILTLRRPIDKLAALLRLAVALLHASGFSLSGERLPDGQAKLGNLRAVERARTSIPLRAVLRFLGVSPSRFQAWGRRQTACALDDQPVLPAHLAAATDACRDPGHRGHGHLARLPARPDRHARRLGAAARYRDRVAVDLVPPRPAVRVATPSSPGASSETAGGPAHDGSGRDVAHRHHRLRLLGGTRAYLHAVIDNFSRRILAWRVADSFAPANSVAVLLEATWGARRATSAPLVLADAGVENVNAQVDALIETGLPRLLAFTELTFSNSMIEAWWRSLKHQWLFLHPLDSVATIRRLVTFYVDQHNHVLPHSAFRGQTPDEMYFGTGVAVPPDLTLRAAAARRARLAANRSASCETCPSLNAAA